MKSPVAAAKSSFVLLPNHGCEHTCINTVGSYRCACAIGYELADDGRRCRSSCGGVYEAVNSTEQVIRSPGFSSAYPKQRDCTWKIVAPAFYKVTTS